MTESDEDYNDAAFFLIEVHDDLGEPKEQLGIEMERVSIHVKIQISLFFPKCFLLLYLWVNLMLTCTSIVKLNPVI